MVKSFDPSQLRKLYIPPPNSHKGQNGKLMIIGGSKLFHGASLWALKVASRIVDMVFYSSVPENNKLVVETKKEFRDGIVVPRDKVENYIKEADCILIGPGLPRVDGEQKGDDDTKELTESLLKKYPKKKWVIDGGSLQTIDPQFIPRNAILTPHVKEFETLFGNTLHATRDTKEDRQRVTSLVSRVAIQHKCTILLKGPTDVVCGMDESTRPPTLALRRVKGGNAGMTKGGTGDVLAGLAAALYCKNDDPFLVASCSSYVNKKAGENLFKKVGYYFNASDLADEIPPTMKELIPAI